MTSTRPFAMFSPLLRLVVVWALALPLASGAAEQRTFESPTAAVNALAAAIKANDEVALVAIFGEKHKSLVTSGEPANRALVAAELANFRAIEGRGEDRGVLLIGTQAWPLPIPLVRVATGWRFATEEGFEELINRRIGGNERSAIRVMRAYIDAQREYASKDRDGDGVLQYAQKLASTPGKFDGLHWLADAAKGEELSPFGPLIADSAAYLKGRKEGDPYRGYHFKILTRQGKSAPGGAYSYVINGRLIAGFALAAYPAEYSETGVMTFIVSQNGKVYEKDLGPASASIGLKMSAFDPGSGWKEVAP